MITNDDDIARNVRRLKNFGRESGGADRHDFIGYNFKFSDIQAKFMLKQFSRLKTKLKRKQYIYGRYYKALKSIMRPHSGTPWFVDIYVDDRDELSSYLAKCGIGTRKMYPLVNTQKPFSDSSILGDSSVDSAYSRRGLWLPSSLSLTDKQIDYVIEAIKNRKR